MLAYAQELVYNLKELMPTQYQKDNFDAMLGLFLSAQGHPLPEHSLAKSPSALSRFLNINPWSTSSFSWLKISCYCNLVLLKAR
jgi:hypothetical protein